MKITIEHESRIVTIQEFPVVNIGDALDLIKDALRACGFSAEDIDDIGFIEREEKKQ